MSNVDINESSYISQRIAANMNIQDLTPQSKTNILVNGLLNEDVIFKTYTEETFKNFFIQTADSATLDRVGVQEGVNRVKVPIMRVSEDDALISLTRETLNGSIQTLEEGSQVVLVEDAYWLEITKDFILDISVGEKLFLECNVRAAPTETNVNFLEGATYQININEDTFRVRFENSVSVPVIEEDLETFRSRLIFAKTTPKTGSESAIRLALADITSITDFSTDFSTTPFKIVIFNHSLFEDDSEKDTLQNYTLPLIDTKLSYIKSEGSLFKTSIAKKINISLELKTTAQSPREVTDVWFNFKNYIENSYKVGKKMVISLAEFTDFCDKQGESFNFLSDYEFNIYKNFLGNEYKSDSKAITIYPDEYPYINEIRVV